MEHGGAHIAYRMEIVIPNSLPLLCKFPQGRCDHAVQSKGCLTALFAGKQNLDSGTQPSRLTDRAAGETYTVPTLPSPRGPLSAHVLGALRSSPHTLPVCPAPLEVDDDDFHLALYACYELHYRGFDQCDNYWEWEPSLLAFRRGLESRFEAELTREARRGAVPADDIEDRLWRLATIDTRPSLSGYLAKNASLTEMREFLMHRSAYHLKEADPHSWGIPRLEGRTKAALVEIQADEYGGGREPLMHSTLFAGTMEALGLDTRYGAYIDLL
ncbi:MAG: hypothetical protein QOG36_2385, partial [Actinomycetota bacterium]|nr:hypothetical protein [Actinomycetota bacterium]